jgi:hypothetical protein
MKKMENKKNFFGLSTKEKIKIVRKASKDANKEQYELIKRQGGMEALKRLIQNIKK